MRFIVDFHIKMRSPELEAPSDMVELALKLWLATGLKMPLNMIKAVSIEKVTKMGAGDTPEHTPDVPKSKKGGV